jgi:hypothetical protein
MAHWKFVLLAVVAGMTLGGCVDSMTAARMRSVQNMQSYHAAAQDDVHIVFSNGSDYRTPIKPWFFGY